MKDPRVAIGARVRPAGATGQLNIAATFRPVRSVSGVMQCMALLVLNVLGLSWALVTGARAGSPADSTRPLGVSPLLFDAAAEVWSVVARADNPVWPGWNAAGTPLLLYLPDRQDLLIGHPHPPQGFVPYVGPLHFPGGAAIAVRDGSTLIAMDGQNTARDVGGVRTLVVADPLSNLRMNLRAMLEDPRPGPEKSRELDLEDLAPDPYDQLALIVHEAFHVFQDHQAPERGVNEGLLVGYPVLSVDNNVAMGLEASALATALSTADTIAFRAAAIRWLAVRQHRRALLPVRARDYEDGIEFTEGLAKYTEYRLLQVLEGRTPGPGIARAQGFAGYRDLAPRRHALIATMKRHLRGEVNVNNSPYGTAPLRMRLYYSGMGIGVLLDRLSNTWKRDVLATDSSLTALVRAALNATANDLAQAWEQARADTSWSTLLAVKQRLAEEGRRDAERRVAAIERGAGTGIEVDYSRLASHQVGMAFTPFGITSVDSVRIIFDQIPIAVTFPDGSRLNETLALPLLRDSHRRTVACRLEQVVSHDEIDRQAGRHSRTRTPGPVKLDLPGVTLDLKRASLEWRRGTLRAVLFPDSAVSDGGVH